MAKAKVVPQRDKELSTDVLLSAVGLTVEEWESYLAVLRAPFASHELAPSTLETLVERGLLRPSLERELGFAPIPPGTAFSKLMARYDEGMLQGMRAGMQLRALLRGVSQAEEVSGGGDPGSGIEVYEDIGQARDRIYELLHEHRGRRLYLLETQPRDVQSHIESVESGKPANSSDDRQYHTVIADSMSALDSRMQQNFRDYRTAGETILEYPGQLPQLLFREDSYLVTWRDPAPSTAATLVITASWAVRLAGEYLRVILPLCSPWIDPSAPVTDQPISVTVAALLARGLTDEQIASRTGISVRTVGRHAAALMDDLGARTRFQAGVLIERRRAARTH